MDEQTPIEINVSDVVRRLNERSGEGNNECFVLLDCREEDEHAMASIEGAVLIPMSQWMARISELSQYNGKQLVVHCHHGGRSLRVAHWLRQNGFPTAQSMAGGIDAWSQQIDPNVPRY